MDAAASGVFDAKAAAAAVARLRFLIETNDGDAPNAIETVAEVLAGAVDVRRIGELRAAVDEFDFDGALAKLNDIARELELAAE